MRGPRQAIGYEHAHALIKRGHVVGEVVVIDGIGQRLVPFVEADAKRCRSAVWLLDEARLHGTQSELVAYRNRSKDRRIEAAAREGLGVVSLNGKMVDGPVIDRARLVLSRAELSGIREE